MSYTISDIHLDKDQYIYGTDIQLHLTFTLTSEKTEVIDDISIEFGGHFGMNTGSEMDHTVFEKRNLGEISLFSGIPVVQKISFSIQRPNLTSRYIQFTNTLTIHYAKFPIIGGSERILPNIFLDLTKVPQPIEKSIHEKTASDQNVSLYSVGYNARTSKKIEEILFYKEDSIHPEIYEKLKRSSIILYGYFLISEYIIGPAKTRGISILQLIVIFIFLQVGIIMLFGVSMGFSRGHTTGLGFMTINILSVLFPFLGVFLSIGGRKSLEKFHTISRNEVGEINTSSVYRPDIYEYLENITVETFGIDITYSYTVYYELIIQSRVGSRDDTKQYRDTIYSLGLMQKSGRSIPDLRNAEINDISSILEKLYFDPLVGKNSAIGYQYRIQFSSPELPDFEEIISLKR